MRVQVRLGDKYIADEGCNVFVCIYACRCDFGDNSIADEGCHEFSKMLETNRTLLSLDLRYVYMYVCMLCVYMYDA
jgi:hypothetical protein